MRLVIERDGVKVDTSREAWDRNRELRFAPKRFSICVRTTEQPTSGIYPANLLAK